MKQLIPWATSAITLVGIHLQGRKSWVGWAVGLGNQALWIAMIVAFGTWGLAPLSAALIVMYTRNLLRWRREDRDLAARPECPVRWDPDLGVWVHRGGYQAVDGVVTS